MGESNIARERNVSVIERTIVGEEKREGIVLRGEVPILRWIASTHLRHPRVRETGRERERERDGFCKAAKSAILGSQVRARARGHVMETRSIRIVVVVVEFIGRARYPDLNTRIRVNGRRIEVETEKANGPRSATWRGPTV